MQRFLITTALEESWKKDRPVLFLGDWCRLHSKKDIWSGLNWNQVPYHWNDRQKLLGDYRYISGVYDSLLCEISIKLNELHSVNYTVGYWRIIIGPWLGCFVQILFDRWSVLKGAIREFEIEGALIFSREREYAIPGDMNDFNRMHVRDDWNEVIFSQLITGWADVPVQFIPPPIVRSGAADGVSSHSRFIRFKNFAKGVLESAIGLTTMNNEAFVYASYLSRRSDIALQIRLGQFPKIWRNITVPIVNVDWEMRKWTLPTKDIHSANEFEVIVRALIPRHIPLSYVEGYGSLRNICNNLPWPATPSVIFTSNAFSSDDVFKAWAAEKVEHGAPLVIGQHGGNYGMALWSYMEEHQIAIADKYLSWGWSRRSEPKVEPVCNLKVISQRQDWDPNGGAVMTELTLPRYSYHMFSSPVASQWLNYFDDQCRFVRALPEHIRKQLTVRLYSDYGWDEAERWRDQFPDIQLDPGIKPLPSLIGRSRVSISTYNATVFLETLALNVPTIIFWDPLYWELNEEASSDIQVLKDAGILHDLPESAAVLLAQVWDDVPGWWAGDVVQQAREKFCAKYSRTPKDPLKHLESALRGAMRTRAKHTNHESQIKTH